MAKRTNNDLQNTTEKLKIKLQETHQKSGVNPGDTVWFDQKWGGRHSLLHLRGEHL
jgi:hypothetical protein